MNYKEANNLLQGRCKKSKKFANNTYLMRDLNSTDILAKYHNTIVTRFKDNGDIILDSGGWRTTSTKERINWFLNGINLYQEKGVWYLIKAWSLDHKERVEKSVVFHDGIKITKRLKICGKSNGKSEEKLQVKVNEYCKDFADAFITGKIDPPGAGDCFDCSMYIEGENSTLGERSKSDHILLHIKEKYYVPSLLHRAIQKYEVCQFTMSFVASLRDPNSGEEGKKFRESKWMQNIAKRDILKSLKKYIRQQLSLAN